MACVEPCRHRLMDVCTSLLVTWLTFLTFLSTDIDASTFSDYIMRARCQASCNSKYGVQPRPGATSFFDVYPAYLCHHNTSHCVQSLYLCGGLCASRAMPAGAYISQAGQNNDICSSSCLEFYRHFGDTGTSTEIQEGHLETGESLQLIRPVVTCRYSALSAHGAGVHISYLRWNVLDTLTNTSTSVPLCFVVALQVVDPSGAISPWRLLGKTNFSFIPTHRLSANMQFRFNVTAVGLGGVVDVTKVTEWAKMPPVSAVPEAPKEVVIVDQYIKYGRVSVMVEWKAADSGGCFFKLYCMGEGGIEDELQAKEVSEWPQFKYEFANLMFGRNYTVQVYTFDKDYKINSRPATVRFQTLACLQHTNYSYVICEPDPPRNISISLGQRSRNEYGRRVVNVTLSWLLPLHATPENRINKFVISWHKHPPFLYTEHVVAHHGETSVPGWQTSLVLPWLHMDSKYEVAVEARAGGGRTSATRMIKLGIPYKDFIAANNSTIPTARYVKGIDKYMYILALLPAFLACLVSIIYFSYRKHRRRHKSVTHHSLVVAKQEELNPLYGMVDTANRCRDLDADNPDPDDFEIDPDRLHFIESLGEGAFGKVLRAKLEAVSNGTDAPSRTVAVKVLKEHASADERRSLLLEMEMMKQFGRHQNVVNMVGCCTSLHSPRICIVMEFCPFGDLRNYLRKCREKDGNHLLIRRPVGQCKERTPINSDSGISQHSNHAADYGGDGSRESRSTFAYSVPSSDTIADGDVFVEENFIDQTTLLSYARQIALGMEFLSLKKFVHRDLAARNILVHNHRLLKISDFGLCRDVYETNIYQPTSARKLPYKWMPLESIFDHVFTTKSDIWSFGIVLWEIVTLGGCPYPAIHNKDLFTLLKNGYRMEKPENCSDEIYEIMSSCWSVHPEERPCFTELRYKLEGMLEATRSYIDLTVSVNTEYYRHDSRNENQLGTFDGRSGHRGGRRLSLVSSEDDPKRSKSSIGSHGSGDSESGTECSFVSRRNHLDFPWEHERLSEYDLDIETDTSLESLHKPYRVAVLRAPSLRNGMMPLLGKVAERGKHARLRQHKLSLSLSEVFDISSDDNVDTLRTSSSGYLAV